MKLSFNLLRPIIFFFCGLGYLPLQSADVDMSRETASIEQVEEKLEKENQEMQKSDDQDINQTKSLY